MNSFSFSCFTGGDVNESAAMTFRQVNHLSASRSDLDGLRDLLAMTGLLQCVVEVFAAVYISNFIEGGQSFNKIRRPKN